jgi:hypothetical protein
MDIGDCMSAHVQLDVELDKLVAEAAVATAGPMMAEDLHGLEVSMIDTTEGVGPLEWTALKISRSAITSVRKPSGRLFDQVRRFSCYRWRKVQRLIKRKARWRKFSK